MIHFDALKRGEINSRSKYAGKREYNLPFCDSSINRITPHFLEL
jgi:hypothetical protein